MPSPIDPKNPVVTCVYDSRAKHIAAIGPAAGRCTFSFDPATDGLGVLAVTPRQVTWKSVPFDPGESNCGSRCAATGTWQTGDARTPLSNPGGARTTFLFDSERRPAQSVELVARALFVFEPCGEEPVVLVFLCASDELRELCELFRRLCAASDRDDAAAIASAVVEHPAIRKRLRAACARVLDKLGPPYRGLIDQLAGETAAVVLEGLALHEFKYRDEGPIRLGKWLSEVILSNAMRTWKRCAPERLKGIVFAAGPLIERSRDEADDEDMLAAARDLIAKIPATPIREAMGDWADGLTIRKSAENRSLSKSTIQRRRAEGVAWIVEFRSSHAEPWC
jgi:hypothetical protein